MRSSRSLTMLALALAAGLRASTPEDSLSAQISARLEARRLALGLDADHAFKLLPTSVEGPKDRHYRFQQTFRGVPVWGGHLVVHTDAQGQERSMTDALQRGITADVSPRIMATEALALADRDLAPRGTYAHAPTAELVLVPRYQKVVNPSPRGGELNASDVARVVVGHDLAWHVHTELENGTEETAHTDYFIDARTGAVLKRWSTLRTTGTTGTGNSQYSGTVTLNTNNTGSGYELVDTTRGTGGTNANTGKAANATYDLAHAAPSNATPGTLFTDSDNTWGDGTNYTSGGSAANNQTAGVDAHYGLQTTWDMYKNVLGRNGIDGAGKATYSRVHYSNNYDNAFWSDGCFCMTYGDGSSFTVLTSLDVAGHEMSHGVCANSANLDYADESGGLNESNSDIFGTMVEFYSKGAGATGTTIPDTGGNWTIGEQLSSTPLRYMYKPSLDGASADAWYSGLGALDVHFSSGPNNRAFYFLSQGASSNSASNFYTSYLPSGMTGIGNQKAAQIWYLALTHYLTPTSTYHDARIAAVRAAADLFPSKTSVPSAEYQAVQNAYHGINVGGAADGTMEDTVAPILSNLQVTGTTGTITLSATATDDRAMGYVAFFVDGVQVGTVSGAGPSYALNLDSTTLPYGNHQLTAVAVDNNGNSSPLSTAVAFSLANATSQGILNGGFEQDYAGWTASAGATIVTNFVHGGLKAARLGGYGQTNSDEVYQTIQLPSSATNLALSFYLMVRTAETGGTAKDTMTVKVKSADGSATLATLRTFSNLDQTSPTPSHVQYTYDLTPYKGQTVRLSFSYTEDAQNFTSFRFDDVSLVETVAPVAVSTVSTATVRKGGSKTFTATVTNATNTAVTWSVQEGASGGTITAGGVYTAPNTLGTYHVVATSVADPSKTSTITVTVTNSPDLNASGKVDGIDLGLLAFKYGVSGASMAEDLDGNGVIDDADLDLLLADFGN